MGVAPEASPHESGTPPRGLGDPSDPAPRCNTQRNLNGSSVLAQKQRKQDICMKDDSQHVRVIYERAINVRIEIHLVSHHVFKFQRKQRNEGFRAKNEEDKPTQNREFA